MALIGTLRDKMIKWVVGFVAVAIAAFVLNDLFGSGATSVLNQSKNVVGEIAGTTIGLKEYQDAIQEQKNYYLANLGRQPNQQEMPSIRTQAWERLILRYAIEPQYKELSLTVTDDEEWDIIQGKNMHESIKQSFTDSTGNFNHQRLIDYLQNLSTQPASSEARIRWNIFKNSLINSRVQTKFDNLMLKTTYITQAEAEQAYHLESDVADINYIYIPFQQVADSLITTSEAELKNYYEENKKKYKVAHTRNISYVLFPVIPSANDSTEIVAELEEVAAGFQTTEEDSLFASINSDNPSVFASYSIATLPTKLSDQIDALSVGSVVGPFREGNSYKLAKVIDIQPDTVVNARASHILIPSQGDEAASKKKAQKILNDIKAGADFAESAKKFGTDGTASKGGDLGWFSSGQMVKPFQEAVFNARKTGLINRLVKTRFGYHIIYVTQTKNSASFVLATIEREIISGDDTRNGAYQKADRFANGINSIDNFNAKADKDSIEVYTAEEIEPNAQRINSINNVRPAVMWLFRDAKKGKVSNVFDAGDNYMVVIMTEETEGQYKPFEKIKEEITSLVRNRKKGEYIIEEMSALTGTLDEIANAYGSNTTVNTLDALKLNSNSLPKVGLDPVAIGRAFALKNNERSAPFSGERGVFIIEMKNRTIAPSIGDYNAFKKGKLQEKRTRTQRNIIPAIKEAVEIEDERYLFY